MVANALCRMAGQVITLLGSPGVGKGTQGVLLSREMDWAHLSTGDLLRRARREGTPLGQKVQKYMDAGELVPDEVIVDLVRELLETMGSEQGVIFDGFPRTIPQAIALEQVLARMDRQVDRAVLLEADDEVLVKRISGRRSSPNGRVYNIYFDPPKRDGHCDETGEQLIHRPDDRPETVKNRLAVYRKETAPLVGFYEQQGILTRIDAGGTVEDVQSKMRTATTARQSTPTPAATG